MTTGKQITHRSRQGATLKAGWWSTLGILCLLLVAGVPASRAQDAPVFTSLFSFDVTDGDNPPYAQLVQGPDGNLYGTTNGGGTYGAGTVFKITPRGTLTSLHSFCAQRGCPDGQYAAGLILASDGNYYGVTNYGGAKSGGTVFTISPQGKLTTLSLLRTSERTAEQCNQFSFRVTQFHVT